MQNSTYDEPDFKPSRMITALNRTPLPGVPHSLTKTLTLVASDLNYLVGIVAIAGLLTLI